MRPVVFVQLVHVLKVGEWVPAFSKRVSREFERHSIRNKPTGERYLFRRSSETAGVQRLAGEVDQAIKADPTKVSYARSISPYVLPQNEQLANWERRVEWATPLK